MGTYVITTRAMNRERRSVTESSEAFTSVLYADEGDVSSFADFYRREFPSMVALASTLVGRSAEDVAQEAMIRAHKKWATISTYDKPGTWVRRVTINLATSTLRRRATRVRKTAQLLNAVPSVKFEHGIDDDLADALLTLSKNQRAAVVLHYLEDLPVVEIAEILGCAPNTAKVHLHRGRQALARQLDTETQLGSETQEIS